jgi:hypothetical protein
MDLLMIARLTLKWPNAYVSAMVLLNSRREYTAFIIGAIRNHETDSYLPCVSRTITDRQSYIRRNLFFSMARKLTQIVFSL